MKIFIINLKKDTKRYDDITSQLKNNNFSNYERIDAILGKDVYKNYNTNLTPAQIGCYLSHLKAYYQIIEQDLDYAIILEDDVKLSEWFTNLENIIKTLPKNFDICWIGNSRAKWPRNPCNIIPDYDYNLIKNNKVNDYVYKIDDHAISTMNYPMGGYGLVISKNAAKKIIEDDKHFIIPIDNYLVFNENLERYMTVPSVIVHCYDHDSNLLPNSNTSKKSDNYYNPFENIWKKYSKQEENTLNILESLTLTLSKNNINYSIMYGTLLGYARNKKFISYDDDIDIIINKKDLSNLEKLFPEIKTYANVFKMSKPIVNQTLYYKLYPKKDFIKVSKKEYGGDYGWPFIDIFIYENKGDHLYFQSHKKKVNIKEEFIDGFLYSHNNDKKYKIKLFKNYEKILDSLYKNWQTKCISSVWNHRLEKNNPKVLEFSCKNIIPDYLSIENFEFPENNKTNKILLIIVIIIICAIIYYCLKY